jgi:hypothetical protein
MGVFASNAQASQRGLRIQGAHNRIAAGYCELVGAAGSKGVLGVNVKTGGGSEVKQHGGSLN